MSLSNVKAFQFKEPESFEKPKKLKVSPLFVPERYNQEIKEILEQRVIETARRQANEIVLEAQKKAEEIKKAAYQEGFQQGFQAGKEKVEKETIQETQRAIANLARIVDEMAQLRQSILQKMEKEILNLALVIAKKIIKDEIKKNPEVVLNNIRDAIQKVTETDTITIKLNPDDYTFIEQKKPAFFDEIGRERKIILVKDKQISPGGCLIETKFGQIDATLETQWKNIVYPLKKVEG